MAINDEAVDWDRPRDRLRDIYAIRIERTAYAETDDDIDFQEVADVIAIARIAGVDRVGVNRDEASGTIYTSGCAPSGCGSDAALLGLRVKVDEAGTVINEPVVGRTLYRLLIASRGFEE